MKLIYLSLILLCSISAAFSQVPEKPKAPKFDAELAKKVGADKFGMRNYVVVFLRTGPTKIADKDELNKIFAGHLANINRLAAEGKLAIAGPFSKDPDYRGMFIFAVETPEEAKLLVETDPAVKAGVLIADYHKWWGSAALMEVNRLHDIVTEAKM